MRLTIQVCFRHLKPAAACRIYVLTTTFCALADDEEICEDIQLLRNNKGFEELDENFSGSRSPDENESGNIAIGDEAGLADSSEANIADASGVSEGGKVKNVEDPSARKLTLSYLILPDCGWSFLTAKLSRNPAASQTKAAMDSIALSIYQWAQTEGAIEEATDIIGGFECPEDISGVSQRDRAFCDSCRNQSPIISLPVPGCEIGMCSGQECSLRDFHSSPVCLRSGKQRVLTS